jgi:hypothetical protein
VANEIYVTPQGTALQRGDLTDEQAAQFLGPYEDWGAANGVAKLVRSGEMGPDKASEAARHARTTPAPAGKPDIKFTFGTPGGGTRTVGLAEASQIMRHNRRIRKAVWWAIGGAVMFIVGLVFVFQSYPVVDGVQATPAMCNSGIGILGQAFDSQAYAACQQTSTIQSMHDWSPFLIVVGILTLAASVAFLSGKTWAKGFIR